MICDTIGLTADSYASMYVHGGLEVEEVYGGLNYADPIFYKSQTLTGSAPLYFNAYSEPLTDYTILGNSYQDGTPSPDNPVEVVSVGDLVTSREHAGEYVIPITCGGVTQNIYLDEPLRKIGNYADEIDFKAGTVTRRIGSIELGSLSYSNYGANCKSYKLNNVIDFGAWVTCTYPCSHLEGNKTNTIYGGTVDGFSITGKYFIICVTDLIGKTPQEFAAAVDGWAVYYIYETPTTEPITLPTIPTINGQNTLSFGTALQPSSVSITGHIKPTGYGQLLDVNDVDIQDKNNEPIFIQG